MSTLIPYATPEHAPFILEGGPDVALLVHGFMGSPAEMRPLAGQLHAAGWTVHVLALPGFGQDLAQLRHVTHRNWIDAVGGRLSKLRASSRRLLLVGNSLGAAVSVTALSELQRGGLSPTRPADGAVFVAPFWRIDSWLDNLLPAAMMLFRQIRPFARANLDDPRTRDGIHQFLPAIDLDDPQVRQELRELKMPTTVLGHVRRAGQLGFQAIHSVETPLLVVQGSSDVLVRPHRTQRLVNRHPGVHRYIEVESDHELIWGNAPGWPQAVAAVLAFAGEVEPT